MSGCATTGCADPHCPVCRFAGRSLSDIQLDLRREWRRTHLGIDEPLPALKQPEERRVKERKART